MPRPLSHLCLALAGFVGFVGWSAAEAQPARTPRQMIETLGVEVRQLLEDPKARRTPEQAEQAVADQIAALARGAEGHPLLTELDLQQRSPLMLAVTGGHLRVVQALLSDPSVRLSVNVPDEAGETPWMLANFAPGVTLVACQPGTLTLERAQLLPPYLRRMADLLKSNAAALKGIVDALQAAGAEATPDAARQAWLARCPNATAELREKMAGSAPLMATLIREAVQRQSAFNKSAAQGFADVPAQPPAGVVFVRLADDKTALARRNLMRVTDMRCQRMPKPELRGTLNWNGELLFRVRASTRAGVVEAADFEIQAAPRDARAVDYFRSVLLRTLANYQCEGTHDFEQEFQFKVN